MIGEVYQYLGGDSFLDGYLKIGEFYTINSMGEVDGNGFVTFKGTDRASYLDILEKNFKNISREREVKLTTLLD